MKHKLLNIFANACILLLCVSGGIFCLQTAFDFSVSGLLVFALLFWVLVGAICPTFQKGWLFILGSVIFWGGFLLLAGVMDQLADLIRTPLSLYISAYSWMTGLNITADPNADVTLALILLAIPMCITIGYRLSLRQSAPPSVLCALLPLLPCVVVTTTVPHVLPLLLLLSGIALLLLTNGIRQQELLQGSRLTAILLIPILLSGWLLLAAVPKDSYRAPEKNATLLELLDLLPFLNVDPNGRFHLDFSGDKLGDNTVDLDSVGPKLKSTAVVMQLRGDLSGTIYLRGRSYGQYDGKAWKADTGSQSVFYVQDTNYLQYSSFSGISYFPVSQSLTIVTRKGMDLQFLPYYPVSKPTVTDGFLANTEGRTEYSFGVNPLAKNWETRWTSDYPYMNVGTFRAFSGFGSYQAYLQLPGSTQKGARAILAQIGVDEQTPYLDAVEKIGNFVRASARYDLNTAKMPRGESDFALWFLEDSSTGYCIHFATAAAVLLRAAGIPARYVEGYTAYMELGTAKVTESQAHAWVEYLVPYLGWVLLDATPAESYHPVTPSGPTAPSTSQAAPTQPSSTRPGSSTAAPSSQPGNSTAPQPTDPADPPPVTRQSPGPWLWILVALAGTAAATVVQWRIRLSLRQKRLSRGKANRQALARWQYVQLLAKLRRQAPPQALKALAQKAKFSQHTLSREELAQFDAYFSRSITHLKQQNILLRLLYRLIFAAY